MTGSSTAAVVRRPRQPAERPPRGARRVGYASAAVVNLVLIWLLNVAPGWEWLTILTDEFASLVGLITASLVVGAAIDLAYVVADPPWMKRLGDAITSAFACVILARTWAIFPFDLDDWWSGWENLLRIGIGFLTVVTAIAVVVNLVLLIRAVVEGGAPPDRGPDPHGQ
jgi:hypothetical protein